MDKRFFVVFLYSILRLLHGQAPAVTGPTQVTLFQNVRVLNKTGQLTLPYECACAGQRH